VVSAHYDGRFAWLLLIQQLRPDLKLLTVFANHSKIVQKVPEKRTKVD
jgi:hypothetical protein